MFEINEVKTCKENGGNVLYDKENITLSTYPISDKFYTKEFTIPTSYAREKIRKWFNMTLEQFLKEYIWEWTDGWPEIAEKEGLLIDTNNVM